MKKEETSIQDHIKLELSKKGCKVFRCNVGNFLTKYGQEISIGIKGHSDLYGVKPGGRAFFVECKTPKGVEKTHQEKFIDAMKSVGALAGFAHSVEDALKIVFPEDYE